MDWNKTKSIFIIVFAILNVFLYSLYLDRYKEAESVDFLSESSNEEKLEAESITYSDLPKEVEALPYVTGTMKTFVATDVPGVDLKKNNRNDRFLSATFTEPIPLNGKASSETLQEFVEETIYEGEQYALWEISEQDRKAVFTQKINGKPLFYSDNGSLTVYWNENGEVTQYEQTIYENVVEGEQQKALISPIQAIHNLYQKRLLPSNTNVDSAELGYSEYVTVSENTQMFLPTWHIKATFEDGKTEEFFVNAVKGDIIEIKEQTEVTQ
ncbi:two-component system regulatory protein YycI [Planococcus sp. 1R117A]|uniref:two-component system regulatory protein YycI n=1 Tax=Planococcus sp. 1R117A TaxID=3447020 RepID=UPI003EDC2C83